MEFEWVLKEEVHQLLKKLKVVLIVRECDLFLNHLLSYKITKVNEIILNSRNVLIDFLCLCTKMKVKRLKNSYFLYLQLSN